MADTKISDLSAVTDVLATDEYVLARAGTTKKIDASNLLVASEVAFTPTGTIAATDVQAAVAEVAVEAAAGATTELDYAQFTSSVSISATTEATANTVVTGASVSYSGSTVVIIEFYAMSVDASVAIAIYDGSSSIGGVYAFATNAQCLHVVKRLTPSAGAHTYSIRAYKGTGSPSVVAGAGGAGNNTPGFMRISRA